MNAGAAVVILFLVALISAFASYWFFLFWRQLPLETELRAAKERAEDLRLFAQEILVLELTTQTAPHALKETGVRVLDALHRRFPDLRWSTREPAS